MITYLFRMNISYAILHWGRNYSTKLRRTIHLSYRAFGSNLVLYRTYLNWTMDFTEHLPCLSRESFERFVQRFAAEFDVIAQVFRAALDKDEGAFCGGLTILHPGEKERMVCVTLLTKLAYKVHLLNQPDIAALPAPAQAERIVWPWECVDVLQKVARRFTRDESDTFWCRFGAMEDKLKSDEDQYVPGFQSGPSRYFFYDMPPNFDVDYSVASWNL